MLKTKQNKKKEGISDKEINKLKTKYIKQRISKAKGFFIRADL